MKWQLWPAINSSWTNRERLVVFGLYCHFKVYVVCLLTRWLCFVLPIMSGVEFTSINLLSINSLFSCLLFTPLCILCTPWCNSCLFIYNEKYKFVSINLSTLADVCTVPPILSFIRRHDGRGEAVECKATSGSLKRIAYSGIRLRLFCLLILIRT